MMLPFTLAAGMLAGPLLRLLFGQQFVGASTALVLLGLAAPLTAAAFLLTTTLATLDARRYIAVAGVALAVNLGGNLLFMPHFGASGAAAMTVASQGFLVCTLWALVRRQLPSTGLPESWKPSPTVPA